MSDFKHIKVNPSNDEIVIQAGIKENPPPQKEEATSEEIVGARSVRARRREAPVVTPPTPNANVPETATTPNAPDNYHPTTLSDLESSKMPKTQIVVIALCVVAIAAFIIWYIVSNA